MRLGLLAGQFGPKMTINLDLILEAEKLGFDSVWTAEAYGNDAATPLAFIAGKTTKIGLGTAIMQMPARTPAMTAMTAMTLDALSGGRVEAALGLGADGEGLDGFSLPAQDRSALFEEAVVVLRLVEYRVLIHCFLHMTRMVEQARAAITYGASFLCRLLG